GRPFPWIPPSPGRGGPPRHPLALEHAPRRLRGGMSDGAAGRRGLGGDLDPPRPGNVLLHGVGDEIAIGAVVEHLAMEGARHERHGEHAAFEADGHAMLDDGAEEGLLLEDLLRRARPSRAEIDRLRALHGGPGGDRRTLPPNRRRPWRTQPRPPSPPARRPPRS